MFKGTKGYLIADFDSRLLLPFGDNADLTYYKPRATDKLLPPLGALPEAVDQRLQGHASRPPATSSTAAT